VEGYEYLLVALDNFTKWVEDELVRALTAQAAVKFIRGIVCHFDVPNRTITNLGSQFTSQEFQDYCNKLGTQTCYASVAQPKSNDQVEHANEEVIQHDKGIDNRARQLSTPEAHLARPNCNTSQNMS
jgi:hypothetical protein